MQPIDIKPGSGAPRWPLLSLLWWTLIIGPLLMPFGLIFLVIVFASILCPPILVCTLLIDGHYFIGPALLVGWSFWLRFGLRLLRWLLQGIEWSSL
jgi:hypothetical protein